MIDGGGAQPDTGLAIDCGALTEALAIGVVLPEESELLAAAVASSAVGLLNDHEAVAIWRAIHGPLPTQILMGSLADGTARFVPLVPPLFPMKGSSVMDNLTIKLGQREFNLPTFTIRQLCAIDARQRQPMAQDDGSNFDFAVDIIAIALTREMPDIDADKVRDMPATGNDLLVALKRILSFANTGTIDEDEPQPADAAVAG